MSVEIIRRTPQCQPLPGSALPSLLTRVYAHRSIGSAEQLDLSLQQLPPPDALSGINAATELLEAAIRQRKRILVVADFDADGATSCALALRALRWMGATDVHFVVPDRFKFGYGLTPEIVAVAAEQRPDLLITVDNGIASVAGVAAAKQRGIKVLITDHHLPGSELPAADAIVNPNQPGCTFPSKNLAGVGVIFYVMLALRARLRTSGWFTGSGPKEPNLARLLDLVAFGTVADVVPLDRVNRTLVAQGLRRIRRGQTVSGVLALIDVTGRNRERLIAADIGFFLGPRLNAAGRIDDMSVGIRCLLCDDPVEAKAMATGLDKLNRARRTIEADMRTQAEQELDALTSSNDGTDAALPFGLCLFDPRWHQGVIGILAARMREHTHRPVIAFAPDRDGQIKGSARSVPGLHVRDALDAVATRHPGLVSKFGGHAMAAGLSLAHADFAAFSQAFDQEVQRHLSRDDLRGVIFSDGELSGGELSLEVAEALRAGGPWGQGFPEPIFDGVFTPLTQRVVGEKHLKLTLRHPGNSGGGFALDAIAFNQGGPDSNAVSTDLRLAYRLDVNEWQGRRSPQLVVEHLEACTLPA